ncbi:MAG: ABC transporter ATP-binding protein [Geobacter sp.]|nr:ABC transporter ATP-binding protein [Geobacter sp.]
MHETLLVQNIHSYYGKSHILFDVNFSVKKGETFCLMGRNGAGKTTTFKSIVMLVPPKEGKVIFNGKEINGLKPYHAARLGIGLVPEDRRIFGDLTVKDNLLLGTSSGRHGYWNLEQIYEYFPILLDYQDKPAGTMSGGEQQMLTIARTLMGNPEILLLDEPTEGLSPVMVKVLKDLVLKIKELGTTILLSEQNIKFCMAVADRVVIIDKGHIVYQADVASFRQDDDVKKKYLAV